MLGSDKCADLLGKRIDGCLVAERVGKGDAVVLADFLENYGEGTVAALGHVDHVFFQFFKFFLELLVADLNALAALLHILNLLLNLLAQAVKLL